MVIEFYDMYKTKFIKARLSASDAFLATPYQGYDVVFENIPHQLHSLSHTERLPYGLKKGISH